MKTSDITDEQVVLAFKESHSRRWSEYPYEILMRSTGAPFKVVWRAMERAEKRDLVEYGVSLRCGWPTEKGLELVK